MSTDRAYLRRAAAPSMSTWAAPQDEDTVLQAVASGLTGYLQKYCTGQKLVSTLRDVIEGELCVLLPRR